LATTRPFLAAALVGALAGLVGAAFHALLDQADLGRVLLRTALESAPVPGWLVLMALGALMLCAALWLVRRFAPETAGSGVQEVEAILAGEHGLRWQRVLPVKFVAGALALSSGLVLGREGPTVHMGAALGQLATERLGLDARQGRTLLAAGAAAGLAAAFNAPLAAIIFVTEELREHFEYSFATLQSVILACCLAVVVSDGLLGQGPALSLPPLGLAPLSALPLFVVLGVLVGVLGVLFNALLLGSLGRLRALREGHAYLTTSALGMALGILVWNAPETMGGGEGLVASLLQGHPDTRFLLILLAARVLTTVGSYGAGLPGGIFAPLLALGTLVGVAFDHLLAGLGLNPGLFAVAAMGALFAATVRAPLTGIILVIELTGALDLGLPIILTCLAATFTAEALGGQPIYSLLLTQGHQPPPPPRAPWRRVLAAGGILVALLGLGPLTAPGPGGMLDGPQGGTAGSETLSNRAAAAPDTGLGVAPPDPTPSRDGTLAPEPTGRDPGGFAIQLLTVTNDAGLAAFAQRHQGVGLFRTLQGQHRGKAWVALLVGDYATRTEAEAALDALPRELRRLKPLVRPLTAGTRLLPVSP
jgi:H+/Cl- antiporter ClcA